MDDEEGAIVLMPRTQRGFTLVEVAVTLGLMALMLRMAMPAFTSWTRNAQVRAVSDALQTGLRQAQAEAATRSRQVVLFRTTATTCSNTIGSNAAGQAWAIRSIALMAGDAVDTLRCGVLADVASGVVIAGPQALCFNSAGRLVGNADPGVTGATCAAPAAGVDAVYDLTATGADRPLRLLVSPGGVVRACDPNRVLSSSQPDGCPA
jgi:type IV fimbrial biogenesis protein FimT